MGYLICVAAIAVFLSLTFMVCLTWTHRPDLSIWDILKELLKGGGKEK